MKNTPLVSKIHTPFVFLLVIFIFRNWILSPVNLGGDFNFVSFEYFKIFTSNPYIWDISLNNGFGQYTLFTLPFFNYAFLLNFFTQQIQNPFTLHKLIYLIPLLLLSIISIYTLSVTVLKNKVAQSITIVLYLTNPYFIMLTSGGQIGVAFAYACAPLVLSYFYKSLLIYQENKNCSISRYLISALLISVEVMFDSRLAIILVGLIATLYVSYLLISPQKGSLLKYYFLLSLSILIIVPLTHAHWLLPSILIKQVSLPNAYTAQGAVDFFSFARFAHALTWSHPNYPDNIFGEVKEVNGLAFIIPIAAFWLIPKKRKIVLFLSGVAIVSAFLIKGSNPPFGEVYSWFFKHVPLFNWFRDSTKFFLPLSLAYALLIGLFFQYELQESKHTKLTKYTLLSVVIASIGIIWWPTFSGKIGGTLAKRSYPLEFQQVQSVLQADNSFGRVLWIPYREVYGYADLNHQAVSFQELLFPPTCNPELCVQPFQGDENTLFTKQDLFAEIDRAFYFLEKPNAIENLRALGIKYIALSPDIENQIYRFDRKYDEEVKQYYRSKVSNIRDLQQTEADLLFKLNTTPSFMYDQNFDPIRYIQFSPVKYDVIIPPGVKEVYVTQSFDTNWVMHISGQEINPLKTSLNLTKYSVTNAGNATLEYQGQSIADLGILISRITILLIISSIIYLRFKQRKV